MAKNQADATAALAAQASDLQAGAAPTNPPAGGDAGPVPGDVKADDLAREPNAAAPDTPAAPVKKRVRARVLVEGQFGSVDDVVQVTEDELQAAQGQLCAHPASVTYALSRK